MKRGLLVLHQGAIGDFVLAMAVVQAVRESTGREHVIAIASAASARISAGRSVIDEWHSPDSMGLYTLFSEDCEIDERLRDVLNRVGLVLNFLCDSQSVPHRRLADHGQVISIDPRPNAEAEHITRQWVQSIRSALFKVAEPSPPRIHIDGMTERNRVVIHPGSGGVAKCWPIEKYIRIADALAVGSVSWMLGPVEMESARFDAIKQRAAEKGERLICEDDLLTSLRRIAGASLYIGNDAGITHLAAAIGLPTVAIFGPSDPRIWRPLGTNVYVVEPLESRRAIDGVSIDQVLAAVYACIENA